MIKSALLIRGQCSFSLLFLVVCYPYRHWLYEMNKKNFILVILTNYFAEKTIQNCWEVVRYCKLALQGEERSRISVLDLTFKIDWSANQKVISWSSCHGDITMPWRGKMKTVVNWTHVIESSYSTNTQSESQQWQLKLHVVSRICVL